MSDSGEGRWTSLAAIDEGVPAHVLTAALYERFSSRGEADFADKVLSAMRKEFGGHDEKPRGTVAPEPAWPTPAGPRCHLAPPRSTAGGHPASPGPPS